MKRILIAAILLSCCQSLFAAGMFPDEDDFTPSTKSAGDNWFVGIGFGAEITAVDDSTLVQRTTPIPDKYLANDQAEVGTANLLFGYQGSHDWKLFPYYSFFIGYTYSVPGKIRGEVQEFSLPTQVNYNYTYEISRQTVQFFGKFDLCDMGHWLPFIIGGIGGSYNRAEDYTETAKPGVTPRVSPAFANDTEFELVYSFGGGIDFKAYDNIWLSLGYLYGDFGDVKTGKGLGVFSTGQLKTQYMTHSIVFNALYFFQR